MARYQNQISSPKSQAELESIVSQFMEAEGFKPAAFKGENVWKKGSGILVAPQYLKTTIADGKVNLEAFVQFAILPGVFVGEYGIDGLFLAVPKKLLKNRVQKLEAALTNTGGASGSF